MTICSGLLLLLLLFPGTVPFAVVLSSTCSFFFMINRSYNVHFMVGYGTAMCILLLHYALLQTQVKEPNMCYAFLIFFLYAMCLGLGTGAGVAIAHCIFHPFVVGQESPSVFSALILIISSIIVAICRPRRRSVLFHLLVVALMVGINELLPVRCYLWFSGVGATAGYVFLFGMETGQAIAPKLSIGGCRSVIVSTVIGFLMGYPLGHGLGRSLISHTPFSAICSTLLCIFIIYMEYNYYRLVYKPSHYVPILQGILDSSMTPCKPVRIALTDCAGDDIYRDSQHLYIAPISRFVVVFRATTLDTDNDMCDATFRIVSQWLDRVASHSKGREVRVHLVATHRATMRCSSTVRADRMKTLEGRLRWIYSQMLTGVPREEKIKDNEHQRLIFQVSENFVK